MNAWIEIRHLRNLTTDRDVLFTDGSSPCEAVEFGAALLVLQLPGIKLATGTLLAVDCLLHFQPGSAVEFPIMGKVVAHEAVAGDCTTIELRQFDTVLWRRFLLKVQDAQARVDALFHKIKGEPYDG
jgi:hypothetical protein